MIQDPPVVPSFHTDHQDLLLAVDYNIYGTRIVTASSDHRLKVFDKKGANWELVDSWRAHDAEITAVRWNGPFAGQIIGSIGEDGYFKLWEEDVSQAQKSGRRFKCIINPVTTKSILPWMSLDFKNINNETYLALITRDGNLSIMEPKDHDNLGGDWTDWMANSDHFVCVKPRHSEESSFKVGFHPDKLPCYTALEAGLDRKSLCLAVVAMDIVKIFRTDKDRRLYLAAELSGAHGLLRDVAWAPFGAIRGYDVIATAGKDGVARIYELRTAAPSTVTENLSRTLTEGREVVKSSSPPKSRASLNAPSGIGAGLAGAGRLNGGAEADAPNPSRVRFDVRLVTELKEHRSPVWRVEFSQTGGFQRHVVRKAHEL